MDVAHEPLHPVVPKDPRAPRVGSSSSVAAPPRTTHSGGASTTSSSNTGVLKMFRGRFAMCRCTDQRLDVLKQRLQIVRSNQQPIHSQRDEPLLSSPTSLSTHLFLTLLTC
jgi:hypothetical protein